MKLNKFTVGAVSGMSALAIGFPVVAQITNAATATPSSSVSAPADMPFDHDRTPLTQEQVQQMADHEKAFLDHLDEFAAILKTAKQAHADALSAAAKITDESQRQEAVRAAFEAERESMKSAIEANPALKDAMPMGGPGFGPGGHHGRPSPEKIAEKLGMTADELKAALDSGKTIRDIAEEKGITLPEPPMGGHGPWFKQGNTNTSANAQ